MFSSALHGVTNSNQTNNDYGNCNTTVILKALFLPRVLNARPPICKG